MSPDLLEDGRSVLPSALHHGLQLYGPYDVELPEQEPAPFFFHNSASGLRMIG